MSNYRSHSSHKTPQAELLRLAELHPTYSLLQVYELLNRDNWHVEDLTEDRKEIYRKLNGLNTLQMMRSVIDNFHSQFILNSPPRQKQWLPTGKYIHVCNVINSEIIGNLLSICDHLLSSVGTPPIKIFENSSVIQKSVLQSIVRTALTSLPDSLPPSCKPAILKKRTLLRRTFPPFYFQSNIGNMNNQFWHQDSNMLFNDSPMLTLWIPLQDGSGLTRPGLQIIDSPVSYFSIEHGDSSPNVFQFLSQLFPESRIVSIQASAGDCIIFNGLTFHQTYATSIMAGHRDALLIRVLDQESAHRFPALNQEKDLLSIA